MMNDMMAVVTGLGDGGLTVTVFDGSNHYTLIPNTRKGHIPSELYSYSCHHTEGYTDSPQHLHNNITESVKFRRDSTIQAEDGRYITMYQTEHCKRRPSSPPVQLSEFPPQRPILSPGHGNFEVGGTGSRDAYPTINKTSNFRGGMNWPDRGCVCSPRSSYEMNVFADSLRKYPISRPDRSAEVLEKLVNYNIGNNGSKYQSQNYPTRLSESYNEMETRAASKSRVCKADFKNKKLVESRIEDKKKESDRQEFLPREYDIRFLRDLSRRAKMCTKIAKLSCVERSSTQSQAAVRMVSREVATAPRSATHRRTIAIPLSPSCSATKGECRYIPRYNSSQTKIENELQVPKLIKIVSSCVDLNNNNCIVSDCRRTRSQEEVKTIDKFRENALQLNPNVSSCVKSSYVNLEFINKALEYNKQQLISNRDPNEMICKNSYIDATNQRLRIDESHIVNKSVAISECELYYIIKCWLSNINLRDKDVLGRRISRNSVLKSAARAIKELITDRNISHDDLKSEILNVIQSMPLKGICNLKCYKNKLISILFDNLINILDKTHLKILNEHTRYIKKSVLSKRKRNAIITETNLKKLVGLMVDDFLEKSNVTICENLLHILKYELVGVLINSLKTLKAGKNSNVKKAIRYIFMKCNQLTKEQADQITDTLNNLTEEIIAESNIYNIFPVFQDLIASKYYTSSMFPIIKRDLNINLYDYAHQLIENIEDWLNNLNIPEIQDSTWKLVAINELASDIIDRQKYLNLNPSKRGSDCTELEYLKYQIFKCINRLVGKDNIETLKHAEDLMSKIKSLPVATTIWSQHGCNIDNCQSNIIKDNQNDLMPIMQNYILKDVVNSEYARSVENISAEPSKLVNFGQNIAINTVEIENQNRNRSTTSECQVKPKQCKNKNNVDESEEQNCEASSSCITPSIKILNEDYDRYLKQWIEKIPISAKDSEEEQLAALARLGILHGIWKAIESIKLDPKIYYNPYHYQDILDDEIESLLQNLPQTKELVSNKHRLKAQLLEKTLTMNEQIKALVIPTSFKQQLFDCLRNNLPKISKLDPLREEEELKNIPLIEDYILYIRFKEDDEIKSNIYKNNFLKKIEYLVDNINRKQKSKNVAHQIHVSELISALNKVPIPDIKQVKDEANDILLGMEVSQWLSNLPLYNNNNAVEKRRIRDNLVIKINEIELQKDCLSSSKQIELRREIRKQFEKLSLQVDDMNFVIEELGKSFNNLPKDEIKYKTVSTQEPQDYAEFSRDMPACSSYMDAAGATHDERSYMINGDNIVRNTGTNNLPRFSQPTISEEQWFSMDITKMPPNMLNWSQNESRLGKSNITNTSTLNGHQVARRVPIVMNSPNDGSSAPYQAMPFPYVHGANAQPGHTCYGQTLHEMPNYVNGPRFHTQPPLHYSQNVLNNESRQQYNSLPISPYNQFLNQFQDRPQAPTSPSTYYGQQYFNGMPNEFNPYPHNSTMKHRVPLNPNNYENFIPVGYSTPTPYNQEFLGSAAIHVPVTTAKSPQFLAPEDPNMQNRNGETIGFGNPISSSSPFPVYAEPSTASTSQNIRSKIIPNAGGADTGNLHTSKMAVPVTSQARHEKPSNATNISDVPVFYRSTEKKGIKNIIKDNKIKHQHESKDNKDKATVTSSLINPVETDTPKSNAPIGYVEFTPTSFQPFGYVTPQQPIPQNYPERPRKRHQNYNYFQRTNDFKQRLELEDPDYESDSEEEEIRCRCMRRHSKMKPRFCYPSYDFFNNYPPFFSNGMLPCPYLHFK